MAEPIKLELPDWRKWLASSVRLGARDSRDYDLHLAALEWGLSSALDINRLEDFLSLPSPNVEPFAHQVDDAILFFRRLAPRGLIADDVGLGKTITAGLVARELLERGRIESLLVVCPRTLIDQWQEELDSKFGIKAVAAVGGDFNSLERQQFWITSYHTARRKIDAIRARKFDLLILDEAHALRNLYGTQSPPQVAKAFEQMMRDDSVRYCLMLTATPIQNRLWDMFSLLEILKAPQPNPLGTPDMFRSRFIADHPTARRLRTGTEVDFRGRVADSTIRTRRADTKLLFPQREVRTERLNPLPEEREYIEAALAVILDFPKLVQITHARTLMSSPWAAAAAFEREAEKPNLQEGRRQQLLALSRKGRAITSSAKIQSVVALVKASAKDGVPGRLIVFTQRIETLQHLVSALRAAGFEQFVAIIQGADPQANLRAIRDFMAEPSARPILLSTDTGAVGLNLQAGNVVINYDLPWNPMLLEQRIGRIQRLGQKASKVVIHNLVLKGTIEDHVVLRLMEKLELFHQAIGEMEELLELCGYDEEQRSLEQVIMDLIRKAAERKDLEEDLRRMEASRRDAEAKMRDMREATEQALASLRPRDTGVRLEGLDRLTPRLPLPQLIKNCLIRAGGEFREDEGRLFVRTVQGHVEFVFDRGASLAGLGEGVRAVLPDTRAFDHLTKPAREQIAHHILDGSRVGLKRVQAALQTRLTPLGMVIDEIAEVRRTARAAIRVGVRAGIEVATDRYETILELDHVQAEDGVEPLLGALDELRDDEGKPLPRCGDADIRPLAERVAMVEERLIEVVKDHASVRRFADFYADRYREDLDRLVEHARTLGHRIPDVDREEAVQRLATQNPSIGSALTSLKLRFTPTLRLEPIGVCGFRYDEVEVKASIRNRNQREAHSVQLRVIPLTGVLKSDAPGADKIAPGDEAWACPGGHITAAEAFVRCQEDGCTAGACRDCAGTSRAGAVLVACSECEAAICNRHKTLCHSCGEPMCRRHANQVWGRAAPACSRCSVKLDDGRLMLASEVAVSAVSGRHAAVTEMEPSTLSRRLALPDELVVCEESGRRVLPDETDTCVITSKRVAADLLEQSAVSDRPGLRSLMKRSEWSGRPCLPGEERICDETGAVLLPDELGQCSMTQRQVRRDLMEEDAETGEPALRRLLGRSDVTGRWILADHLKRSGHTGRAGLTSESLSCAICHQTLLSDEAVQCPDTGTRACPDHFERCEASGERVLPEALARCEVTGRQMRRALLAPCPETGAIAAKDLFETCEATGMSVLPGGLAQSTVSGKRVRRSLLVACQSSGQLALPSEFASCTVSGKLVRPDLLVTCPDTGARLLPEHSAACEESGQLVAPAAIGACAETHRRVRRSLLAVDDLDGRAVLSRLLKACSVSGLQTVERNLTASSISGKPALPDRMVRCEVTSRLALPGELATCGVTGKAVHPELLTDCAETGVRMLETAGHRCEATGVVVAPNAIGACEETGKRVRRSVLALDDVTGKTVLAPLLRSCERTGRRTLPANLVTSAVTGKQVLATIAHRCEETGAAALPDELAGCEATGKRVLPSLLERCEASGQLVLRRLLHPCESSGKRVLPEYLSLCGRSGKTVLTTIMAHRSCPESAGCGSC